MIRLLTEADRQATLEFLAAERVGFRDIGTWDMVPARGGTPGAASAG
ncbi:hypothetical protein Tmar_2161 [Thermaerobacter marianensis DSM 12885]|uniref:Uncharacterized protein n=1 Tax=Thermaerobacter marianensis (strain ATCC 700841 / DSM 12885 / JCM 10246 / 7p75a) TaxID=644966 RepID=E6SK83_THEM7|nr:hypothetical protein [Thermaerobacter marianensis]ADU52241.1 hypothetical protein Tmar_2161 [Thermaerobacter marianensis DSM 12885]